ncbi:MAG: hypothetical protein AABZ92_03395, partial [Verrucomicrobiota bacterium]
IRSQKYECEKIELRKAQLKSLNRIANSLASLDSTIMSQMCGQKTTEPIIHNQSGFGAFGQKTTEPSNHNQSGFGAFGQKTGFGFGFGQTGFDLLYTEAKEKRDKEAKEKEEHEKESKKKEKEAKALKRKEAKKAKAIRDAIRDAPKIKEAQDFANIAAVRAERYAREIETFIDCLDQSLVSIFRLMDLKQLGSSARKYANEAKAAAESASRADNLKQTLKFSEEANDAYRKANKANLKMKEEKKWFEKWMPNYVNYCSRELTEEELFEVNVFTWFKHKTFDHVVRGIDQFIKTDNVRSILSDLDKHKNTIKAYKELSRLFHPDTLHKHKDLSEFEKFQYITIMKVLNAAKSDE